MVFPPNPRMTRTRRWLVALTLVVAVPIAPLAAQVAAGVTRVVRLDVTTTSTDARAAFVAGMDDLMAPFATRAAARLKSAVDLDPSFGMARVIYGTSAAGLTAVERNEAIARGMADVAKASTGEQLVAMAYRENFRNNPVGARALLLSAATVAPDEPFIAWQRAILLTALPGATATDAIPALKTVIERFPDFAPAYNNLAYGQWQAGAKAAAIQTARTYMAKAPSHPNSHDSYAELVQWDGNYTEAVTHYTRALEIDPTYLAGAYGLSEVYMLSGKGDLARQALNAALPHSTTPAQRVTAFNRIAASYVLEGNIKAAMATLGTVIEEATKAEMNGAIVAGHAGLMNLEAAFGNPKTSAQAIAAHIGHMAAVPPPPAAAGPPNPVGRYAGYGTAYAIAGRPAEARVYLDSLKQREQSNPGAGVTAQVHAVAGWALYSEGKFTEALAEFRQSNQQNPSVRAGTALTQFKLGNLAEARSLRDELVNDRNLNLANTGNVFYRRIVKQRII